MSVFFISGIDTDIGKTYATAALACFVTTSTASQL